MIINFDFVLKNRGQSFVCDPDFQYSDEILWEARISPYSVAAAIPDDKIRELVKLIPKVLNDATDKIDKAYPGRINDEVKEFLKIHLLLVLKQLLILLLSEQHTNYFVGK